MVWIAVHMKVVASRSEESLGTEYRQPHFRPNQDSSLIRYSSGDQIRFVYNPGLLSESNTQPTEDLSLVTKNLDLNLDPDYRLPKILEISYNLFFQIKDLHKVTRKGTSVVLQKQIKFTNL